LFAHVEMHVRKSPLRDVDRWTVLAFVTPEEETVSVKAAQTIARQHFRVSSHMTGGLPVHIFPQLSTMIGLHNMYYTHTVADDCL
jgi:hypothetical protein